ncbi:MAG: 2-oxo-4-hydroxy-4-carboxy-5-ureidoimidazoline decarboxylase [Planctomycetes bacterium]|nr:2-oxo-4-hydroxy-4-carboxy-5-ureidoimidazoline decarboxylase [Planctomycetota bacterium]
MATLPMEAVNRLPREEFVKLFAEVFEHSAWVVESAAELRPFATPQSMHETMFKLIEQSGNEKIIAFLCAHPDLAGQEARAGDITAFSTGEQARAGLDSLSKEEFEEINRLNREYRKRHRFPFIACVKHYTKAGIFYEMRTRLPNPTEEEFAAAMRQIKAITYYRIEKALQVDS